MDIGTSNNIRSKERKSDKSKRVWSVKEEEVLLQSLKDPATAGFKSENGFHCGYLVFLEYSMKKIFPGTDLRGNSHINSKIHVWKRTHGALLTMLSRSGVGWNDTDKMIEATNEAWNDFVKSDNNLRTMRYKRWPYYNDWCEIFGHYHATGKHAESFTDVFQGVLNMGETRGHDMNDGLEYLLHTVEDNVELISGVHQSSISATTSKKSHSKKRKHQMQGDDVFVEAINKFTDIVKNIGQDHEISKATKEVFDALGMLPYLTVEDRVIAAEMLVEKPYKLSLLFGLPHEARLMLVMRLLKSV